MLSALLPLLESLGAEGGSAASLGRHSGLGSTLGRLLGGSQVQPFGNQNDLGNAFRQISDLTSGISAAKESLSSMRLEHEQLGQKAAEDERLYGFRDPQEQRRMADLQQQQIEHARQMQLQQQQMEALQARAAVTMDPQLARQEQRRATFGRAGAIEVGGQLGIQGARAAGSWAYQPLGEAASFVGGQAGNIVNDMAGQASSSLSNVASTATHGASLGMALGGPAGAAVGGVAGGVAQAGIEIAKLPNRIKDWSESLLASQKTISRFSGVMAQAFAQRDVRSLKRDFASAQVTGGSTADLTRSMEDLYDILRPLKDSMTIVVSRELSSLVKLLTNLAPSLTQLAGGVAVIADMLTGFSFNLSGELLKAMKEVQAEEGRAAIRRSKAGFGAASAIGRLQAEDPAKPRQAPRR